MQSGIVSRSHYRFAFTQRPIHHYNYSLSQSLLTQRREFRFLMSMTPSSLADVKRRVRFVPVVRLLTRPIAVRIFHYVYARPCTSTSGHVLAAFSLGAYLAK